MLDQPRNLIARRTGAMSGSIYIAAENSFGRKTLMPAALRKAVAICGKPSGCLWVCRAVGSARQEIDVKRHPELPPLRHEELPPPSGL